MRPTMKHPNIHRNVVTRLDGRTRSRMDDLMNQSRAQTPTRHAFPDASPTPVDPAVQATRERLRHDQESGLNVFGWVIGCAVVTALVVACYVVWRVHG